MAQLPELTDVTWHVYAMTAAGLGIIYLCPYIPKIGKIIPSPLVCIVVLTAIAIIFKIDIRTVGDMGDLPDTLPIFLWPDVPLNWETLMIILPYSIPLAAVGLLESMMTATIVDDMTDTTSDKNRECKGQGVANIATGLLGGMAGCAIRNLKTHPLSSNIVMLTTVTVVVATHNLAYGVFIGVLMAAMFFANKIGHYMAVTSELNADGSERTYQVFGEVFFRSADMFVTGFDLKEKLPKVVIDLTHAHFWDITSVAALDKVVLKFRKEGVEVDVINMNKATTTIVDNFGVHHKPEDITQVMGH